MLLGGTLAAVIASGALWAGALSSDGALAAFAVGTITFGLGGIWWAIALLAFFFSSSGLSFLFRRHKTRLSEKFSKGKRRDAAQVLANGGMAALLAAAHHWIPDAAWIWAGFCGSLAAVNADTWATEIGVLSKSRPRAILSNKTVEPGTSGGVTALGFLASLAGALLLGLIAALNTPQPISALTAATVGGFLGAILDSIIGARWQARYRCPQCHTETEQHPFHTCGARTVLTHGLPWLNNDLVNLAAALAGAFIAAAIFLIWRMG